MGVGEKSANTLAMVVHELATNSVKHGALSSDAGTLEITGVVHDDHLDLTWAETGGPSVDDIPELTGFGSKMIARIINTALGGAIGYDWQSTGLVVTLTARSDLLAQ